jgi:putative ABC transport system permease protein
LAVFAGIAVLLAGFGIYGTVTSAVAVRRRELGVRLALGATRPHVLMKAARSGAAPTLIGVAAGVPLALMGGRILRDQLYGVEPMDWATILAVAGLVAALTPAIRATRIDPVAVLKHEAAT